VPTISQLQYIVTVDKLHHFGRAADACHVSQPSLSAQIHKVEEEINVVIFDRQKKPVTTTPKGAVFVEQAKVVLREHYKLMEIAKKSEHELIGHFNLGVIPTVAPYLIPLFIADFSNHFPKVQLKIEEMKTDTIVDELKRDDLDGAILATPLEESSLIERVLYYEDFYLYVSEKNKLSQHKFIKEEDLDGSELWLLEDGHCLRNQIIKMCSLRKDSPVFKNISFESGNLDTLRNLVKNSHGYTVLPATQVHNLSSEERRKYVRHFKAPIPSREISLIYRKDQWKLDILKAIESSILNNIPKSLKQNVSIKTNHVLGV
jgi:LysR family transcriptional regulator, hydrogen peroxide-inducible genes activator